MWSNQTKEKVNSPYMIKMVDSMLSEYDNLIERPSNRWLLHLCAQRYMNMDQYEKALADAKKSVELCPGFIEGYFLIIEIAIGMGNFIEADFQLAKLSQVDPTNKDLKTQQGRIFAARQFIENADQSFANKRYENALANINKAIDICPHCIQYKIRKGEILLMCGDYKAATFLANTILQLDEMNIDAKCIQVFSIYYSDVKKAFDELKKIMGRIPQISCFSIKAQDLYKKAKDLIHKTNKADEAFRRKDYRTAHSIFRKAIAIDPDNKKMTTTLYCKMGQASFRMEKFNDAIEEYTKALKIDPNYVEASVGQDKSYAALKNLLIRFDLQKGIHQVQTRSEESGHSSVNSEFDCDEGLLARIRLHCDPYSWASTTSASRSVFHICQCKGYCTKRCGCRTAGFPCVRRCGCKGRCLE